MYENPDDIFGYFGNGWTLQDDADPEADRTWYMGQPNKQVSQETIDALKGTAPSVTDVLYGVEAMKVGPE